MGELSIPKNSLAKLSFKSIVFFKPTPKNLVQNNKKKPNNSQEETEKKEDKKVKKTYKLNKSLIRKRLAVLFETKAFRKQKSLWTLSFPEHCTNDDRYRILNIFLTRLRRDFDLKHYVWVAEYHKSGFIHFHIITNLYAPVQQLNAVLRASIITNAKNKGTELDQQKAEIYQGFDISKKKGGDRNMSKYVTKYVTKNNAEFDRLSWYCSQSVSNLCTGVTVSQEYIDECFTIKYIKEKNNYCYQGEHFIYLSFNEILWCDVLYEMETHNNEVMRHFEQKE